MRAERRGGSIKVLDCSREAKRIFPSDLYLDNDPKAGVTIGEPVETAPAVTLVNEPMQPEPTNKKCNLRAHKNAA